MGNQALKIESLLKEVVLHIRMANVSKSNDEKLELAKQAIQSISPAKAPHISQNEEWVKLINEVSKVTPNEDNYWIPERKERLLANVNEIKELCSHSFFNDTPATIIQAKINESIISKSFGDIEKAINEINTFFHVHQLMIWGIVGQLLVALSSLQEKVRKEKVSLQSTIAQLIVQENMGYDKPFVMGALWKRFFDNEEQAEQCLREMLEIEKSKKVRANIEDQIKTFVTYANKDNYIKAKCSSYEMKDILGGYNIIINEKAFEVDRVIKAFENK